MSTTDRHCRGKKMKKKIVMGVIALLVTAGMAVFAGSAGAGVKVGFIHNGHAICVSEHAAAAHRRHKDKRTKACGKKKAKKKA